MIIYELFWLEKNTLAEYWQLQLAHFWLVDTCISRKTNLDGYDIAMLNNIYSADACMSMCYDSPQCICFTFALLHSSCYIKYAQQTPTSTSLGDSGPRFCPGRLFGTHLNTYTCVCTCLFMSKYVCMSVLVWVCLCLYISVHI